jgi:hypothetical protein
MSRTVATQVAERANQSLNVRDQKRALFVQGKLSRRARIQLEPTRRIPFDRLLNEKNETNNNHGHHSPTDPTRRPAKARLTTGGSLSVG